MAPGAISGTEPELTSTSASMRLLELSQMPVDLSRMPPPGSLPAILNAHVHVAHVSGLVDTGYCSSVLGVLEKVGFSNYDIEGADTAAVLKIGPTVFDRANAGDGLDNYFDTAESVDADLRRRFQDAGIVDPLELLMAVLRFMWCGPVEVARQGDRQYYAGVVRSIAEGAPPHHDNAHRRPGLSIAETESQGSILLYLRMPPAGGGLKVYHKRGTRLDPVDEIGFEHVAGVEFSGVTPSMGDVVIIPSSCFHAVEPVIGEGERVTISSFFGPLPDGRLVLWS
jgi:hypothetical protein